MLFESWRNASKPEISFDIKSPNAPETGKGLIERVVNDDDELSRQFFSYCY